MTIHLAFLRWVRVRIKAYGSERQELSHRFKSAVVTSWFAQLFVLLAGEFLAPHSAARNLSTLYTHDSSLFLPKAFQFVSDSWPWQSFVSDSWLWRPLVSNSCFLLALGAWGYHSRL